VISPYLDTFSFKAEIEFAWKGEKKTIEDIYSNINSSLSNPIFVFAFYDILYKFTIAAIFYFTAVSIQNVNKPTSEISDIIKKGNILYYYFPVTFKEFIDEYNEQLNKYTNNKHQELHSLLSGLINKLEVFGIYMQIPNEFNKDQHTIEDFNSNLKVLKNLVAKVATNFFTLQNMY